MKKAEGFFRLLVSLIETEEIVFTDKAKAEIRNYLCPKPKVYEDPLEEAMQDSEFTFTNENITLYGKNWITSSEGEKEMYGVAVIDKNGINFSIHYFSDYEDLKKVLNYQEIRSIFEKEKK